MSNFPHTVTQELTLIQSKTLRDFVDINKAQRIMMMPYWYRCDDGMMVFNFISARTDDAELKKEIKEGRIYIRDTSKTMTVTEIK